MRVNVTPRDKTFFTFYVSCWRKHPC
jgi:hypothetical protein